MCPKRAQIIIMKYLVSLIDACSFCCPCKDQRQNNLLRQPRMLLLCTSTSVITGILDQQEWSFALTFSPSQRVSRDTSGKLQVFQQPFYCWYLFCKHVEHSTIELHIKMFKMPNKNKCVLK